MATPEDYPKHAEEVSQKMTDAQLKAMALKQYSENLTGENVQTNEAFPTEEVQLPSRGKLYPEGHPLSKGFVTMRYMTAKHEDILTTPSLIKSGKVFDKLLSSLIVEKLDYRDVMTCDRDALMLAARIMGYGPDYPVTIVTPSGKDQETTVDLNLLNHQAVNLENLNNENRFKFTLPLSKKEVYFKLLNGHDLEMLAKLKKQMRTESDTTVTLVQMVMSIDGRAERDFIQKEVDNMLVRDARALRDYANEIAPGIDYEYEFEDKETNKPFRGNVPIGLNLFYPDLKA